MGWNGSGVITLLYDWTTDRDGGSPTHFILAERHDSMWNDIADAIEATLNRNGENAIAANISWANFKITNLGAATTTTDAVRARQVAENALQYGGSTGGSANAYTLTHSFISAAAAGTRLLCLANHTNNGAATLNVNGGGAVAIKGDDGSTALAAGEIVSGRYFEVVYDGTYWRLYRPGIEKVQGASITPWTNDGSSLGTSSLSFSDVFLATGGVVNFGAGDVTITHSSGLLTFSDPISLGTSNALTCGSIELGHASDCTITRVSAGTIAIEGSTIVTSSSTDTLTNKSIDLGSNTLTFTSAQLAAACSNETGSGALMFATSPTITTDITIPNTGLHLLDTNASHDLIIAPGSNLTADHTLTLTTGDADRTITLSGNPTLADWFDQSVKAAATPAFAGATFTSPTVGAGYATGAGGSVTQITSKSTGVELNKICGQITTHNAALASGSEVSFVVTNSTVDPTDVIIANLASGNTADAYSIWVDAVSDGSFRIGLSNVSGGSLSQALVINFAVIKAVAA